MDDFSLRANQATGTVYTIIIKYYLLLNKTHMYFINRKMFVFLFC